MANATAKDDSQCLRKCSGIHVQGFTAFEKTRTDEEISFETLDLENNV